ncbi:hypothetical protein F8388_001804 [Cannabis sativa]|uniref:Uncharacterized protein n=1 Tax=Cannabis sativa TaxID=3483 RepID=A0A7J6F370_CANSA|nr:hypothetical protein F8388_013620 [Cannabis sativa]KAF4365056.1 hypothetical protein F8388_001804 [Cannabis sativa]
MEIAAGELEDDLFFKDLSKQISLLIMDEEEEEEEEEDPLANYPSVSFQAFSHVIHNNIPPAVQSHQFVYEQSCKRESSKGTGVFIPQSSQPRRKQRHGRSSFGSSYYAKSHRQSENNNNNYQNNTKIVVSHHHHQQVASSGSFKPKYSRV